MNLITLSLVLSFAGPLLLIPVEKFLPYPYLIEEAYKLICVFLIYKSKIKKNYFFALAILVGFLFAFSETIFYLVNIFALGNLLVIPKRLVFTTALHLVTILLITVLGKKGGFWWLVGFLGAALIHYFYNFFWIG